MTILATTLVYLAYVLCLPVAIRYFGPPALQFDDSYFFLISYSWLNGLGFNNFWVNPVGTGAFNWHGFLQPMLVAELSPCNTLHCVNTGLIVLGFIYLVVWYIVVNTITTNQLLRWACYAIAVSLVIEYSSRPELLASLELICIVYLFYLYSGADQYLVRAIGSGTFVAVAFLTSPFAGVFAGLTVAAAITFLRRNDQNNFAFMKEGALSLFSALCVVTLLFACIYPYSVAVWIEGMAKHGVRDFNRNDTSGFVYLSFFRKNLPLMGLMYITLAGVAAGALRQMWMTQRRFLLAIFLSVSAVFLYVLYFSVIRIPLTYYNFTVLIPSFDSHRNNLDGTFRHPATLANSIHRPNCRVCNGLLVWPSTLDDAVAK